MAPPAALHGLCQITEHLYISNMRAATDVSQLERFQITCVINVTEKRTVGGNNGGGGGNGGSDAAGSDVDYVHIPVADSPLSPLADHFDRAADAIESAGRAGGRTLVHCNAGVSRSAALCMAYLLKHRGYTLREAHALVRARRPIVRPNAGFWRQLIGYETELRGCASVRMVPSNLGEIPDVYEDESKNMLPL